jgi:hypothetical protein
VSVRPTRAVWRTVVEAVSVHLFRPQRGPRVVEDDAEFDVPFAVPARTVTSDILGATTHTRQAPFAAPPLLCRLDLG